MSTRHHLSTLTGAALLVLGGALLAGCSAAGDPGASPSPARDQVVEQGAGQEEPGVDGPDASEAPAPSAAQQDDRRPPAPPDADTRPVSHVHGVAVDPVDGSLLVGTHEGTFVLRDGRMSALGEVIDLMGFAVSPDGRLLASGHPGPGSALPDPVGLVESLDGGATWVPLSRQGQSDFHALVASADGVLGFDGVALRSTADGTTWAEVDIPEPPFDLGASPGGDLLVSTHASGPMVSTDRGASWTRPPGAPVVQLVHVIDRSTVVGVAPDGTVLLSTDAGDGWSPVGAVPGPPHALTAWQGPDGLEVVVAVTGGLLRVVPGGEPESLATY